MDNITRLFLSFLLKRMGAKKSIKIGCVSLVQTSGKIYETHIGTMSN